MVSATWLEPVPVVHHNLPVLAGGHCFVTNRRDRNWWTTSGGNLCCFACVSWYRYELTSWVVSRVQWRWSQMEKFDAWALTELEWNDMVWRCYANFESPINSKPVCNLPACTTDGPEGHVLQLIHQKLLGTTGKLISRKTPIAMHQEAAEWLPDWFSASFCAVKIGRPADRLMVPDKTTILLTPPLEMPLLSRESRMWADYLCVFSAVKRIEIENFRGGLRIAGQWVVLRPLHTAVSMATAGAAMH